VRSIYWHKRLTQARISSADLHEVSQKEIEGRIILIGTTAAGLSDTRATPLEPSVPGVEIHAQMIEVFFSNAILARPDWARPPRSWSD
jgi:adenylate cyclase